MTKQFLYLFSLFICGFLLLSGTALADVQLYLESAVSTTSAGSVVEVTVLASAAVPLNVFELTLDAGLSVVNFETIKRSSPLCEERFVIEESLSTNSGQYYVACGTTTPFLSETPVPILTLRYRAASVDIPQIGEQTSFYQHDGLGTEANWEEYREE